MTLLELAERCERATGPDREIDCRISAALQGIPFETARAVVSDFGQWNARPYTASLDAAMSLVPEGWHVSGLREEWSRTWTARLAQRPTDRQRAAYEGGNTIMLNDAEGIAFSAAPALTAACLRARATLPEGEER